MTLFGHARLLLFGADDIHTMLPNKVYKSSAQRAELNCSSSCGWGGTDDFVLRSIADSESLRLISSIKILNWNSVFFSFFAMCTQCGGIKLAKSSPSSSHIQLTRTDVLKSMTSHSRLPAEQWAAHQVKRWWTTFFYAHTKHTERLKFYVDVGQ